MCSYSLVCTLYAVCMHPQLHTFTSSEPYGHAYSRFCMHCMQSIPELCSRIACIVGFLMHTMHTTFDRPSERQSRRIAYTPAGTCDNRRLRIGRDGGGQSVRRAVKARKSPSSAKTDSEKGHSWFVEECLKTRAVEDKRTDNIRRSRRRILSLFTLYVFALTCMHFVCSLYASPTAYIYSPSVLRTRLFAFLYALYAVFFGVMFPHSMHSRFFDAYNAYNLSIVHPSDEADRTDEVRTCPQKRAMTVRQEWSE